MNTSKRFTSHICGALALVLIALFIGTVPLSKVSAEGQATPGATQTQASKPLPTATAQAKKQQDTDKPDSAPTFLDILGAPYSGTIVNFLVAIFTLSAVIVALSTSNRQIAENSKQLDKQIKESDRQLKEQIEASSKQLKEQIEESRRLATEERRYQSCPIIVPREEIPRVVPESINKQINKMALYEPNGTIHWNSAVLVPIKVCNIGGGAALNVHCVLHNGSNTYGQQFFSWDHEPIKGGGEDTIVCDHPNGNEFILAHDDTIDGNNPLYVYDSSDPKAARLTITYHDLWGDKYVSIFDYTLDHQWERIFVRMPFDEKIALDLKEKNIQKKRQAIKYSAPPAQTSP